MIVELKGKSYRVTEHHVEVFIPAGPPRVMQKGVRSSYWRTLNPDGLIALRARLRAEKLKRKEQRK
jgi:hypothetical protein